MLRPFHTRFIDEYRCDFNGAAAYIRAGGKNKDPYSASSELLAREDVCKELVRRAESSTLHGVMTANEILRQLTKIAMGDLQEECIVVEGTGNGFSKARVKNKKVQPKDSLKALELLGKAHQIWVDRVKTEDVPHIVDDIGGGDTDEN